MLIDITKSFYLYYIHLTHFICILSHTVQMASYIIALYVYFNLMYGVHYVSSHDKGEDQLNVWSALRVIPW